MQREPDVYHMWTVGFFYHKRQTLKFWNLEFPLDSWYFCPFAFLEVEGGTPLWKINVSSLGEEAKMSVLQTAGLEKRGFLQRLWHVGFPFSLSLTSVLRSVCSACSDRIEMWKSSWSFVSWQVYILEWAPTRWDCDSAVPSFNLISIYSSCWRPLVELRMVLVFKD